MMDYLLLIFGFVALIYGASILVTGASSIAKRFKISDLTIGLTIVAMGTSAPEMIVGVLSSFEGNSGIALGNLVGSNIFNTFIILGSAALVSPILVQNKTVKVEIPYNLLAAVALWILASDWAIDQTDNVISRTDAYIMLLFFIVFLHYSFSTAKTDVEDNDTSKLKSIWMSLLMLCGGIVLLFFGGRWVVDSSSAIAKSFGMSETLIGLTIVAIGTSLPELVTSIIAAKRGNPSIAIGNVLGSNVFNLFFILPISALIAPIHVVGNFTIDLAMACFGAVVLFAFSLIGPGRKVDRTEGFIMILIYFSYFCYLLLSYLS